MKIAVNARFLLPHKLEGFGWYSYEVISRMCRNHPEHEFILFFDRPYDQKFIFSKNITPIILSPPARHPFLHYYWFEFAVFKALKRIKADLFFSPDGYISLKSKVPTLAVIHDINFEHYPKDLKFWARNYYKRFFPRYAHHAAHIVTVSEFSKQDIIQQYQIRPNKISVRYNGVGNHFYPKSESENLAIKQKYAGGNDFFLFVGALTPRKNLDRLFLAFDLFKEKNKNNIRLLIVGEKYFWNKKTEKIYSQLKFKNEVSFTGHMQVDKLAQIYSATLGLCFVSYFEGFGLPIVEAMKSGVPVLCANQSASPEIAGDAAILCNPFDEKDISSKMELMAFDQNLRQELIKKGKSRALQFNWDEHEKLVWNDLMQIKNA